MPRGPLVTAEERNKFLRMSLAGLSRSEIAKECGRSVGTIHKALGPVNKEKAIENEAPRDPNSA